MPPSSALPLNVTPSSTPSKLIETDSTLDKTPKATNYQKVMPSNPGEISSPHELTAFVEALLEQLDTKFDEMSSQILDRMGQMSSRVDALEASIQDIINGDITTPSVPQSPVPSSASSAPGMRRSGSGVL